MEALYAQAEYGKVTLQTKDLPAPGPGQLLLEAEYSAISPGTEHTLLSGQILPLPQKIGYSMIARVIDTGQGVKGFKAGDLIAATAEHASHLILDERLATPVPEGIDLEQAAFFNLSHTAMYGIRRTKVQPGESVAVLGQGIIGLLTAQLARIAGACPVIVTARNDGRLEYSKAMGAHHMINVRENPDELYYVVDRLGTGGVSVVFEAAGSREPLDSAFRIVKEQGRVMLLGVVSAADGGGGLSHEALVNLFEKGVTLIGGYVNTKPHSLKRHDLTMEKQWPPVLKEGAERFVSADVWTSDEDIRALLNLIRNGMLDIEPLITHRFSADRIPEAYEMVWKQDRSLIGGLIKWK